MGPPSEWNKNRHLQIIALARYYIEIEQTEEAEEALRAEFLGENCGDKAEFQRYVRIISKEAGLDAEELERTRFPSSSVCQTTSL